MFCPLKFSSDVDLLINAACDKSGCEWWVDHGIDCDKGNCAIYELGVASNLFSRKREHDNSKTE